MRPSPWPALALALAAGLALVGLLLFVQRAVTE